MNDWWGKGALTWVCQPQRGAAAWVRAREILALWAAAATAQHHESQLYHGHASLQQILVPCLLPLLRTYILGAGLCLLWQSLPKKGKYHSVYSIAPRYAAGYSAGQR